MIKKIIIVILVVLIFYLIFRTKDNFTDTDYTGGSGAPLPGLWHGTISLQQTR